MKIDTTEALEKLSRIALPFLTLFEHGTLSVEEHKMDNVDLPPHRRDEVYVVNLGRGGILNKGFRTAFKAGDFIFVPAGIEHRLENFTDDFSNWVGFHRPDGAEIAQTK